MSNNCLTNQWLADSQTHTQTYIHWCDCKNGNTPFLRMEVSQTTEVNVEREILQDYEEDRDRFLTLKVGCDATIPISFKSISITNPIYLKAVTITWKHK